MTQPVSAGADHSICLFATIRASLPDTLAFGYYHLNTGIDRLYLFFDDPEDPAIGALEGEKRITCIPCTGAHWQDLVGDLPRAKLSINVKQEANARMAVQRARQDGYTWIGHIDSDELVYAPGGLRQMLAAIPPEVDIVKFPVLEAVPENQPVQSAFRELHFFKRARQAVPKNRYIFLDPRERLPYFFHFVSYRARQILAGVQGCPIVFQRYIKGHAMGKSIARTSAPIVSFRSHFPIPLERTRMQINLFSGGTILHYDFPDFDHWLTKWKSRFATIQQGVVPMKLSIHRQRQFDEFIRVYEQGSEADLQALFQRTLLVSPRARRILTRMHLATEIHLPAAVFTPPPGE